MTEPHRNDAGAVKRLAGEFAAKEEEHVAALDQWLERTHRPSETPERDAARRGRSVRICPGVPRDLAGNPETRLRRRSSPRPRRF